eukprot:7998446-Pyramimonas_sp.AAC.1
MGFVHPPGMTCSRMLILLRQEVYTPLQRPRAHDGPPRPWGLRELAHALGERQMSHLLGAEHEEQQPG